MAVALVFATAPFSCSTTGQGPGQDPPIDDPDAFWVNATVEFTPVEGGCWRLTTDETSYEPVSLDQEFQEGRRSNRDPTWPASAWSGRSWRCCRSGNGERRATTNPDQAPS
jgi:hypothetical protein